MGQYWGCPVCGKKSSRRWNAERHIKEVHKLDGQPVKLDHDSFSQQESVQEPHRPLEIISQQRQNISEYGIAIGFPDLNDDSWISKARKLIDRTITGYPNDLKIELYNGSSEGYGSFYPDHDKIVGYRGIVCARCLSISVLEVLLKGRNFIKVEHRCQVGHVRYSLGIENRNAIVEQLYIEELPMLMSILIEKLESKLGMSRYLFAKRETPLEESVDIDANNIGGNKRLGTALFSQGSPISNSEMQIFFKQSGFHTCNRFRVKMPVGDPMYYIIGIALVDK